MITNSIGTLHVDAIKADLLFVAAAKSLSASPPAPNAANHNVDHFKCCKIKVISNTPKFPKGVQALVSDQFTVPAVRNDLKKPTDLCNPVDKTGEGIKVPGRKLLGQPPHLARVGLYVNNQFGPARLDTIKEDKLCVPSAETPRDFRTREGLQTQRAA